MRNLLIIGGSADNHGVSITVGLRTSRWVCFYDVWQMPLNRFLEFVNSEALAAEAGIFNFNPAANYTKWMNDFDDAQLATGDLPGIVPTGTWGYGIGPAWDSAYLLIPYYLHRHCGDSRILAASVEAVTESGGPASEAEGVRFVRTQDRWAVFEVGAGKYGFRHSVTYSP